MKVCVFKIEVLSLYKNSHHIHQKNNTQQLVQFSANKSTLLKSYLHKISLESGKRITQKPYFIKALNEQGIPLTDFVAYGEDLEHFVRAVDFFDNQEFENAQKEIDKALELKRKEDYEELKVDIEIKLNNEQVVDEEFKKYEFDIDSAIHTGKFSDWLKVLINNHKYDKVIHFINQANKTFFWFIFGFYWF